MKKIVSVIALLVTTACSSEQITSGKVFNKAHTPSTTSTQMVPVGGPGSTQTWMEQTVTTPETWTVSFRKMIDGKEYRRTVQVTKRLFDRIKVGDQFSIDQLLEKE